METEDHEQSEYTGKLDSTPDVSSPQGQGGVVKSWNRHLRDGLFWSRQDGETLRRYVDRIHAKYELLGEGEPTRKHLAFYTHTNPYGCDWCFLYLLAGYLIQELDIIARELDDREDH